MRLSGLNEVEGYISERHCFFLVNIDAFFLAPRYTSINKYVDIPYLIIVSSFRTQTGLFSSY